MNKLLDLLLTYLKGRTYWAAIEPFVIVAVGWGCAQLLAYQWLGASSSFKPSIELFLNSYLSKRITIAALGIAAVMLAMRSFHRKDDAPGPVGRLAHYWQKNQTAIVRRTLAIVLIVAAVAVGFRVYSPNRVRNITVRFMSLDDQVTPEALAYLVYELNRRQRHWYFKVDFRPFNPEILTSTEAERCDGDQRPQLCHTLGLSGGEPFIGITAASLGGAYFAEHLGGVSVISTADRDAYAPLSTYEYLAYCLILQAIVIHLDLSGALPDDAFAEDRVTHGGYFQFVPEKQALKSAMLAARLGPDEEALLLNEFGSDYVTTCASLLTMEWLHAGRVRTNLESVFGTKIGR
jgi:hypothetical protein